MNITYDRYNHAVGQNFWHLEWCTKYRYKMFSKEHYRNLCCIALTEAAKRHNIKLVELSVLPEHTHMIATLPRGMTDIKALNLLKGFTSRLLFMLCPEFRLRYPRGHLWSEGSFAATVGFTDLQKEIDYVKNQYIHHAA